MAVKIWHGNNTLRSVKVIKEHTHMDLKSSKEAFDKGIIEVTPDVDVDELMHDLEILDNTVQWV